ncbi:hypothetical protein ADUPG1_000470 [Aduncisulcus paluster]|uniref:Uncharacterized protein n=2 Tax=Aduncisulcus paluster TaxID=2918883 RepID=A0ABQ5K6H4_9EUKA|nr:hypothetical protein ADUPG1_000470 [Aduncisulcus paluster]
MSTDQKDEQGPRSIPSTITSDVSQIGQGVSKHSDGKRTQFGGSGGKDRGRSGREYDSDRRGGKGHYGGKRRYAGREDRSMTDGKNENEVVQRRSSIRSDTTHHSDQASISSAHIAPGSQPSQEKPGGGSGRRGRGGQRRDGRRYGGRDRRGRGQWGKRH